MKNITLIGDSIFDNGPYVDKGDSVSELLAVELGHEGNVHLLAVDGDVTTDVSKQLSRFPQETTHAFVSCGGNDALHMALVLTRPSSSVGESLVMMSEVVSTFRVNYRNMLLQILSHTNKLTVCSVYNNVPGIAAGELTALALFNEVILEESVSLHLPIIDLRAFCTDEQDYSPLSPIEPSKYGAEKIVERIMKVSNTHKFDTGYSAIYA